jgi:hypothetical protein
MNIITQFFSGVCFFSIECACGFRTEWRYTLEAAGRDADLHMAEKFPRGSERRPCP